MLILAIDTSSRTGSVALLRDATVLAEVSGYEETPHSTRLFRDLAVLQSLTPFSMGQIDVFAVASGPGSFTGLRVGLTAVKAWSEVHGKPIAAVSALRVIAAQSKLSENNSGGGTELIAPFLDARRGQIFGSLYRRNEGKSHRLQSLVEESILSPEEFLELVKGNAQSQRPVLVSPTPDVVPAGLLGKIFPGISVQSVSPVLAPAIGRLGFEQAQRGELLDALGLDANYVRRSDAEAAWKDA
jgi:tRNA threonylcarbamoyladenosine biosynthesis protein TsaB